MEFREITIANYSQVKNIFSQGITTENATFETQAPNYEAWDKSHLKFSRISLYDEDKMVGWAALTAVSDRCVFEGVAEVSIYISTHFTRKGYGRVLLNKLIEDSEVNGIWTLQSVIMIENVASIKLHEDCGFRIVGYREKVGKLNGKWRDNILMERRSKKIGIN